MFDHYGPIVFNCVHLEHLDQFLSNYMAQGFLTWIKIIAPIKVFPARCVYVWRGRGGLMILVFSS